jgi:chromosome segregation ATPase
MTKLTDAQEQICTLKKEIEKLETSVKNEKSYKEMYQRNAETANKELEELHGFLDGVPIALKREEEVGKYNTLVRRSALVRLAGWLGAIKES